VGVHALLRHNALATVYGSMMLWDLPRMCGLLPDPAELAGRAWIPVLQADSLTLACMLAQSILLALAATMPGAAAC